MLYVNLDYRVPTIFQIFIFFISELYVSSSTKVRRFQLFCDDIFSGVFSETLIKHI